MVSIAAKKMDSGVFQSKILGIAKKCGLDIATLLKKNKLNPDYSRQEIVDAMLSILLAYSADAADPMRRVLLASLADVLPEDADGIQFVRPDDEMSHMAAAMSMAYDAQKPSEAASIAQTGLIDHIQRQLEATQNAYAGGGNLPIHFTGQDELVDAFVSVPSQIGRETVWERVREPGACDWCREQKTYIQLSDSSFPRHRGCRCSRIMRTRSV